MFLLEYRVANQVLMSPMNIRRYSGKAVFRVVILSKYKELNLLPLRMQLQSFLKNTMTKLYSVVRKLLKLILVLILYQL